MVTLVPLDTEALYSALKVSRSASNTLATIPPCVVASEPTWGAFCGQASLPALWIWSMRSFGCGLPVPDRFTHAAVFVSSDLPLLVMNLMETPHPFDEKTSLLVNGQLLRAMGNTHGVGGSVGGFAVAIAEAPIFIGNSPPRRLRKFPATCFLYRHMTALTTVPSKEGSNRLPAPMPSGLPGSQIPSVTSP